MIKPWSNLRLFALFIGAFLVFLPLRWDPAPWLEAQSQSLLQQLPFAVEIGQSSVTWRGIEMQQVSMDLPEATKPLVFSRVRMMPAWGQLAQGTPTMKITVDSEALHGAVAVAVSDGYAQLSDVDVSLSLPWLLAQWQLPMMVELSGDVQLQGDARIYLGDGHALPQPMNVALLAKWTQATVKLGESPSQLGDYVVQLDGLAQATWAWKVSGGTLLALDGQGTIQTSTQPWQQWALQGSVVMKNAPSSPLTAMLGAQRQIALTGTVLAPQWNM